MNDVMWMMFIIGIIAAIFIIMDALPKPPKEKDFYHDQQ